MNASKYTTIQQGCGETLKGIVEKDDVVWNDVLDYQSEILDYISVMGLELIVKKCIQTLPTDLSLHPRSVLSPLLVSSAVCRTAPC